VQAKTVLVVWSLNEKFEVLPHVPRKFLEDEPNLVFREWSHSFNLEKRFSALSKLPAVVLAF
jgi:hypothetical protein